MKFTLHNVRLAFPAVFVAKPMSGDTTSEPFYSAVLIVDPDSPDVAKLDKVILEVATERWKDKTKTIMADLLEKRRICFVKGPKKNSSGEVFAGFEDMFHVTSSNKTRPTVVDRRANIVTAEDGLVYGGCYVNAILDIWPQDNKFGKRINAQLQGIQYVGKGDAFTGGTPVAPGEFEDLGVEDEDEDLA